MSKRKAETQRGIKAAFAKAKEVSNAPVRKLRILETAAELHPVPDVYFEGEPRQRYDRYREKQFKHLSILVKAAQQWQQARSHSSSSSAKAPAMTLAAGLDSPASIADLDAAAASDNAASIAMRWQTDAAFIVQQLSSWAGTQVPLQPLLQEYLLHITLNYDLHLDPLVSVRAYQLLQQNLAAHPPLTAVFTQEGEPQQLEGNGLCWTPLRKAEIDKERSADAKDHVPPAFAQIFGGERFNLLSALVRNAVHIVTGHPDSSSWHDKKPVSDQPSCGKGLLLLYMVQLLQADVLVRLSVYEQHMEYAKACAGHEVQTIQRRAATVLRDSLLHRLLQIDGNWTKYGDETSSRSRLLRDLLLLSASSAPDRSTAASTATAHAAPAAQSSSAGPDQLAPAEAAAAAAAAVQPIQPHELIGAARRLLLLLLQLYSGLEATGEYATHQARGSGGQNDRWHIDNVILHSLHGSYMLPLLRESPGAAAALQRLLQLLPAAHLVRLVALGAAKDICKRNREEAGVRKSNHIEALDHYITDEGRGFSEFRQGDALEIVRALADRLDWSNRDVFGGKEAFALVVSRFVTAAITGKQVPAAELAEFKQVAQQVLDSVLQHNRAQLARTCALEGSSEVLTSLGLAIQQCST